MATDADESAPDQLDAIIALYCADREKVSTLANEQLALLAIQVTYLGLAVIALSGQRPIGGEWVAAFSAAPIWFINAHLQVLVAAALTRSRSVTLLENFLFERAGLPNSTRNLIGHRSGVLVRDLSKQPKAFRVQSAIAFTGIGATMVAFTCYALAVTASSASWVSPPVMLAACFYGGFTIASGIAWHRTARMPRG
jgi:hypothetical protein